MNSEKKKIEVTDPKDNSSHVMRGKLKFFQRNAQDFHRRLATMNQTYILYYMLVTKVCIKTRQRPFFHWRN